MTVSNIAQITWIAKRYGYQKIQAKNGFHYYARNITIEGWIRGIKLCFSDPSGYGRQQDAGATADIVGWEKDNLSREQVSNMFRFPELAEEIQCGGDLTKLLEKYAPVVEVKGVMK